VNQYIKKATHIFLISATLITITGCFAPNVLPIDPSNAEQKIIEKQVRTFQRVNSKEVLDAAESVLRTYKKNPNFTRDANTLTMLSHKVVFLVLYHRFDIEKWVVVAKNHDDGAIATVSMGVQSDVSIPYASGSLTITDDDTTIDYETFWRGVENLLNGLPSPICRKSTWSFDALCSTKGKTFLTELNIKKLLSIPANRSEVIAVLGKPSRQMPASATRKNISYLACKTKKGFDLLDRDDPVGDYDATDGDNNCYELIFEFDQTGQISGLRRIPYTDGKFVLPDGKIMDSLRPLAESGLAPAQYQLYVKSGRQPDYIVWLCRSADNGYAKAQIDIGHMYWSATDIAQHRVKAYAWYKHAATGDINKDIANYKQSQSRALLLMEEAEKELTEEQLYEAENIYREWEQGKCEIDIPNDARIN